MTEDEEETKTTKVKKKNKVELTQISVQTAPAYKLPDGTIIPSDQELLVFMMNEILEIKRAVA